MLYPSCPRLLIAALAAVCPLGSQQPPVQRRLEIRVGEIRVNPPPGPEPGDVIRIDDNGDVIIEHVKPTVGVQRYRIPRRNKVAPEIVTDLEFVGRDRVRYTYQISNGPSARQDVITVGIGVSKAHTTAIQTGPAGWRRLGVSSGPPVRYVWHSFERTTDIAPGRGTGPFVLDVPMLPGLTKAYLEGYMLPGEGVLDTRNWRLSPWLYNKLEEALSFENYAVQPVIVGAKLDIAAMQKAEHLAEAIGEELLAASRLSEFQEHQTYLETTGSYVKTAGKAAAGVRGTLSQLGSTRLQKSFFRAMAMNLEYLEKLP
jgi:hypothetical protein